MKRKTAVVLLGSLALLTAFSGCGNNEATEAASESAQTEDEGTGDDAEMQEALERRGAGRKKRKRKTHRKTRKKQRKLKRKQ